VIRVILAPTQEAHWAQRQVAAHHYLRAAVDVRSRPLVYLVQALEFWSSTTPHHRTFTVGCLIFGRPEATRCYVGGLTYGSQADVAADRARFDRWEVLNLARVWLDPCVQPGGALYRPDVLPGFTDRRGAWRSTLASAAIGQVLQQVRRDYLLAHPPCFLEEPYQLRACLSYCDTRLHRGTIYRASGFQLARRNAAGIETWWTSLAPLTDAEDLDVRRASQRSPRAQRYRAQRQVAQQELAL
jgi:hypothetical protein